MQVKTYLASLVRRLDEHAEAIELTGFSGSECAYLASGLGTTAPSPVVVVAASDDQARRFQIDAGFFADPHRAQPELFPAYHLQPFKPVSYHGETAARRMRMLYRLLNADRQQLVITSVEALMQRLVPKKALAAYAELLAVHEQADRDALIAKLTLGGYTRAVLVEEPGDFCVRGGIVDVFSPLYEDPLRIEFFGDTVDAIRSFSAVNQRKIADRTEAVILPAREAILDPDTLTEVIQRIRQQAARGDMPAARLRTIVEKIRQQSDFPGIEGLTPLIYDGLDTFFDFLPPESRIVLLEPGALEKSALAVEERVRTNYRRALAESRLCVDPESLYLNWAQLQRALARFRPLALKMLAVTPAATVCARPARRFHCGIVDNSDLQLALKQERGRERPFAPLAGWLDRQRKANLRTLLVCRSRPQAERLDALLRPYGIDLEPIEEFAMLADAGPGAYVCRGLLSRGFVWPDAGLALLTEDEIFSKKSRRPVESKPSARQALLEFNDLQAGDLVVHDDHGIGRYQGLVNLALNGAAGDFLLITYRDGDKLYLPVVRMNVIQKYMGVDGVVPVLDKMGGKSWERVKARVKKSVAKIAGELLKLYASRKVVKGFAFDPPDRYFHDFEAGFSYRETADQARAIQDVLHDMTQPVPMDRLICGDVGYGKTEVALRAAFLAASSGKQTALLVPTTVLAEQHFATFKRRFDPYAVQVDLLSRFRTPAQQAKTLEDLKSGRVDIVIGTHRLLSRDVGFKDLGLLILDEEQRFGVKHKEKLKAMRQTVDVLTLTATPIPRTLHLSLTGVRDISIISTPPEDRRPVITYISEFEEAVAGEAIRQELARGGQIYFVHNNIHSIDAMAARLKSLVPEVRLDVAHGRMKERDLERVMLRFIHRDIDLLVCTTIIESGLDIPSVNTLLINRADRFGLSQMYQLRGRVGRSDEQAYAYLFIPREGLLGRDARKRLKVLMEYSDLGSGFQIALNDLKIRGGGTILGASQSGHIAAVGYDMFLRLMEQATSEIKGEPQCAPLEPEVNVKLSAYMPEDYISDIDQRLSIYRRLSKMSTLQELVDIKQELADRFGPLPEAAGNLLVKVMLKVLCRRAGIKRLDLSGSAVQLQFSRSHLADPQALVDLALTAPERWRFSTDTTLCVRLGGGSAKGGLMQVKNILKEITRRVNAC